MKHFINLSSCIINKLHIVQILKTPDKYKVYMVNNSINGYLILGGGLLNTSHHIILLKYVKKIIQKILI